MPKAKTPTQHGRDLVEYYLKKYEGQYGQLPRKVNRGNLVFGFRDFYQDYGDECRPIIDYFFDAYSMHEPKDFIYKYGDIAESKIEDEDDAREREEIYRNTVKMLLNKEDR